MEIIIDLLIILIVVLSIWLGYKKWLTESLLKIFNFFIALIISIILFTPISNFVINNTQIDEFLQDSIISKFNNNEEVGEVETENNIVEKEYESIVDKECLINEIENLSKRDKEILILRYGLNNKKEYTQKEVADMLGISQSYISRIEKKAIKRLKSLMKV